MPPLQGQQKTDPETGYEVQNLGSGEFTGSTPPGYDPNAPAGQERAARTPNPFDVAEKQMKAAPAGKTANPFDVAERGMKASTSKLPSTDSIPGELRLDPKGIRQMLGVPYKWGGETCKGIDCSAFMQHLYARNGVAGLPRTADEQWTSGKGVIVPGLNGIRPGDQIFFQSGRLGPGKASHTGYFAGWDIVNGQRVPMMYAASSVAKAVVKQRLDHYLAASGMQFLGAKRYAEFQHPVERPAHIAGPPHPQKVQAQQATLRAATQSDVQDVKGGRTAVEAFKEKWLTDPEDKSVPMMAANALARDPNDKTWKARLAKMSPVSQMAILEKSAEMRHASREYNPSDPTGYAQKSAETQMQSPRLLTQAKGALQGLAAGAVDPRLMAAGELLGPAAELAKGAAVVRGGMAARGAIKAIPKVAGALGAGAVAGMMAPQIKQDIEQGRYGALAVHGVAAALPLLAVGARVRKSGTLGNTHADSGVVVEDHQGKQYVRTDNGHSVPIDETWQPSKGGAGRETPATLAGTRPAPARRATAQMSDADVDAALARAKGETDATTQGKGPGDDQQQHIGVPQGQDVRSDESQVRQEESGQAGGRGGPQRGKKVGQEGQEAGQVAPFSIRREEPSTEPGTVRTMHPSEIRIAPDRFQFKRDVGEGGVGGELKDTDVYDPELGGVLSVWRDPADGHTYVINGHHRLELANRTGAPEVTARYIRAANESEARTTGALINIAEGRGTPVDAAKVFRETKMTPEQLARRGVSLKGTIARDGLALSRLPDALWGMVYRGEMEPGRGAAIGGSGLSETDQLQLAKLVGQEEAKGKPLSDAEVAETAQFLHDAPQHTTSEEGLFGAMETTRSLAPEKGRLSRFLKERLGKEKRTFGAAGKEQAGHLLQSVEGQTINVAENARIAKERAQAVEIMNRMAGLRGTPINEALNEAAARIANGENANAVKEELYQKAIASIRAAFRSGAGEDARGPEGPRTAAPDIFTEPEPAPDERGRSLPTSPVRPAEPQREVGAAREPWQMTRKKRGQLSSGIDPEIVKAYVDLGGFYLEGGIRSFAEWARAMRQEDPDADDEHLRAAWAQLNKPEDQATEIAPGPEAQTTGIAQRVQTARAEQGKAAPYQPGAGSTPEAMIEQGRAAIQGGVDPEQHLAMMEQRGSAVSGEDMAILRAHHEALSRATDRAADKYGVNSPEWREAFSRENEWYKRMSPYRTEWQKLGVAQQGETDIDTGSFTGVARAFTQVAGREMNHGEQVRAKAWTDRIQSLEEQLKQHEEASRTATEALRTADAERATKRMQEEEERETRRQGRARTRTDLQAQRKDIAASIQAKLSRLSAGVPVDILPEVGRLAKSFVAEGVTHVEDLVDKVHAFLSDYIDDLDKRDVRDAISGYGKTSTPQADAVTQQLNQMKRAARLMSQIEDVQAKQKPQRSGFKPADDSPEVVKLRAELDDALKHAGMSRAWSMSDAARLKAAKTTTEARITELERRIRAGDFSARPPAKPVTDASLDAMKARRDALQKQYDAMKPPRAVDDATKQKAAKTRMQSQIDELNRRIDEKDFTAKKRAKVALDAEGLEMQVEKEKLKAQLQSMVEAARPKTFWERATAVHREFILSGFSVFEKLLGATAWGYPTEAAADIVGSGLRAIVPGLKRIADINGREAAPIGTTLRAEVKGARAMLSREAMRRSYESSLLPKVVAAARAKIRGEDVAKAWHEAAAGMNGLTALAGAKQKSMELGGIMGSFHGAEKAFLQTAEFHRAGLIRTEAALRAGLDVNDPEVKAQITHDAAVDAWNMILQGENKLSTALNSALAGVGRTSPAGEAFLRTLAPITTVPANYLGRAAEMTGLGIPRGAYLQIKAVLGERAGVKITPEQAGAIVRAYKYGGLGLAAAVIGWNQPSGFQAGGWYSPDEKRQGQQGLKPDELRVVGVTVPRVLSHSPFALAVQFWATMRKAYDRGGAPSGLAAVSRGMAEQTPGLEATKQVGQAAFGREGEMGKAVGAYGRGLVEPQLLQQVAAWLDGQAQRKPRGLVDEFRMGSPVFRQQVPTGTAGRARHGKPATGGDMTRAPSSNRDAGYFSFRGR